ncbi:manganese efflux pump MntP family protein [Dehalobacterium formicoaceticum]|uniref:manganese efflux pump MntP n=1 Tax=Dehalobacterium formicoaceticum TaxID=51515 RepID=UPI000B7D2680|nr:manganese efflux pump [Dehalobacterium formicoaceticum]
MGLWTLLLVALALGTDAFALAIGIGVIGISRKKIIIVSLVICLFHIFMPLIGLGIGQLLGGLIGNLAAVIGAVVLIFIGLNMLWEVFKNRRRIISFSRGKQEQNLKGKKNRSVDSFWGLMMLAASVSIDALSVGFGLGALKAQIFQTVIVLGVVAGLMTATGFHLGRGLGSRLGERAEIMGGIILVAVGIKLLF